MKIMWFNHYFLHLCIKETRNICFQLQIFPSHHWLPENNIKNNLEWYIIQILCWWDNWKQLCWNSITDSCKCLGYHMVDVEPDSNVVWNWAKIKMSKWQMKYKASLHRQSKCATYKNISIIRNNIYFIVCVSMSQNCVKSSLTKNTNIY